MRKCKETDSDPEGQIYFDRFKKLAMKALGVLVSRRGPAVAPVPHGDAGEHEQRPEC